MCFRNPLLFICLAILLMASVYADDPKNQFDGPRTHLRITGEYQLRHAPNYFTVSGGSLFLSPDSINDFAIEAPLQLSTTMDLHATAVSFFTASEQFTMTVKMKNQKFDGKDTMVEYQLFGTSTVQCTPAWTSLSFRMSNSQCVGQYFSMNFTSNVVWISPDNQVT